MRNWSPLNAADEEAQRGGALKHVPRLAINGALRVRLAGSADTWSPALMAERRRPTCERRADITAERHPVIVGPLDPNSAPPSHRACRSAATAQAVMTPRRHI